LPRRAAAGDVVKFVGEFAAKYSPDEKGFNVAQAWLWRSGDKVWGRFIQGHAHYDWGMDAQTWPVEFEGKCSDDCKTLSLRFPGGTLTRRSENEITAQMPNKGEVVLTRGEVIPAYVLDLAPLANEKENKTWIEAISRFGPFVWRAPREE